MITRHGRAKQLAQVSRITYTRPWVYPQQEAFLFTPKRYSFVEATTKSGKTQGCLIWLAEKAILEGHERWNGWWVAPVHGQAKIAYRRMKLMFAPLGKLVRTHDSDQTITLPNGAVLWFKSGEKPDNLYGEDVYAAVLDEASRMREDSWFAVRSTLTATRGPIRIIGNVKGRKNWFYNLARKAQAGDPEMYYDKLTAYDAVGAGILDKAEVEDARKMLPEAVFNELYLAEPTEDGSNPFGIAAIGKCLMDRLVNDQTAAKGVDLAKSIDYTVKIGLAREHRRMTQFDRYQKSWETTTEDLAKWIGMTPTTIDDTGVGNPIVERLQKGRSNVTGYTFSPSSKQRLMEGLVLAISQSAEAGIQWIYRGPGDVLKNELEAFEYVYTKTGVRYSAPEGQHDDTVMALALAVEQHSMLGRGATKGGKLVTV